MRLNHRLPERRTRAFDSVVQDHFLIKHIYSLRPSWKIWLRMKIVYYPQLGLEVDMQHSSAPGGNQVLIVWLRKSRQRGAELKEPAAGDQGIPW